MQEKTNKLVSLPAKLTIALGQYFLNRQLSYKQLISSSTVRETSGRATTSETWREGRHWDKSADLQRIKACLTNKIPCFESSAGTFWFGTKTRTLLVNASTWPLAEVWVDK